MIGDNNDEILLSNEENRLTVHPIKFENVWELYKKQQKCFWTAEEIDFSKDTKDWEKLKIEEKHFIKHVLAFFAASDTIVNINLIDRFLKEVNILEVQIGYTFQAMMENVHSEVYSLMIDTYIKDEKEKTFLLNAVENIECVAEKSKWAFKWIKSNEDFAVRLVAFSVVEGVFFSGSFCAIYWLKERNLMPGLTLSNEFIARDEGLHVEYACELYSMLRNKLDVEIVNEIVKEAVEIETVFITESLPCKLIGMNSNSMIEYIKYVADGLLIDLGYPKMYNVSNPFDFMENISLEGKTNFFESRVSQYKKADLSNSSAFELSDNF
jgi:ribonucleotide reductase beta subunit family protein with ferritin-like domain